VDPVGPAVAELGQVLGLSLRDADAASQALEATPTLVILDNLESLTGAPLAELLEAAAAWSGAGDSRVLITTRSPDLAHPAFPTRESKLCR
jgi:hypothetical protein